MRVHEKNPNFFFAISKDNQILSMCQYFIRILFYSTQTWWWIYHKTILQQHLFLIFVLLWQENESCYITFEKVIKVKSICLIHKSIHHSKENTRAKVFGPSIARSNFSICYCMVIQELSNRSRIARLQKLQCQVTCMLTGQQRKNRLRWPYYILLLLFSLKFFSVVKELSHRFPKSSISVCSIINWN